MSYDTKATINRALWVWSAKRGIGFLRGSSHVSDAGRFLVHSDELDGAYGGSLYEFEICSPEAATWLDGFLTGAEPQAWFSDEQFDYDPEDPRTSTWHEALELFHRTGTWAPGRSCEVCHVELLPSAPVGLRCPEHHPGAVNGVYPSYWPSVEDRPPSEP